MIVRACLVGVSVQGVDMCNTGVRVSLHVIILALVFTSHVARMLHTGMLRSNACIAVEPGYHATLPVLPASSAREPHYHTAAHSSLTSSSADSESATSSCPCAAAAASSDTRFLKSSSVKSCLLPAAAAFAAVRRCCACGLRAGLSCHVSPCA